MRTMGRFLGLAKSWTPHQPILVGLCGAMTSAGLRPEGGNIPSTAQGETGTDGANRQVNYSSGCQSSPPAGSPCSTRIDFTSSFSDGQANRASAK